MNEINPFYTIIVAGGTGKRMSSILPKQFMELNGKPILMHTLSAFSQNIHQPTIILVLAQEEESTWKELIKKILQQNDVEKLADEIDIFEIL